MDGKDLSAKKAYGRIGVALAVVCISSIVMQVLAGIIVGIITKNSNLFDENGWLKWVATFLPVYASFIIGILIMKKIPKDGCESVKLGTKNFFVIMLCCFPIIYGGNIIGTLLSELLSGGNAENGLNEFAFDNNPIKIIVIVILAPLLEELFFRKQIIDRCARYGEKTAIMFSALAFGLFHMNLFQFFYAFGVGLVFAYTYIRTRRLRYPVIMHMVINFMGSVIAPAIISSLDMEKLDKMSTGTMNDTEILQMLPQLLGFLLYVFALLGLSIAGLIVLIVMIRKLVFLPKEQEIEKGKCFKTVYCNIGVILFILICIAMCVLALVI